ncbi:nucleotidyltransferase substrate binding protein [Rickettsiales bacterium]|nr:nucleotidyltransferase substrate binding protein [Rickettsiales bacterium]MDB2550626.1 nucleotidyltransferase substrate binding protein [Rickettsiales bacterium]
MLQKDIRWQQRFNNYQKALSMLSKFIQKTDLNELEEQGLIQSFEYTHELAWKTLADFIKDSGNSKIYGSKDAAREAFNLGLISNGAIWMDMIVSRNMTSHTYNEETTIKIISAIKNNYYQEFQKLEKKFLELL